MMTSSADLFLNFGMRVDRDAAAVVAHAQDIAVGSRNSTSMRVAWPATASSMALSMTSAKRWCSALVGAADIHAGAAADRLQPFQHLDA
jgi:hypothetical protein